MGEVRWIKITTNMFEDEKIDFIESLPECDAILVIWIKLLAQAGKTNMNGFIFLTENIPYTDEMLSHKFRRPLNVVKLALQTLKQLQMIEFDEEGYLKISNWEKHQNIEGLDKIRKQNRIRQERYREKQKELSSNVTVTLCNETDIELEEELDIEMIKQIIEQRNKEDELNIIPDSYIRLLEYMDASGVVLRLLGDIDALLKTREQERLRLAEQEKQRIVRETELENQRIAQEQEDKRIEEMEDIEISGIEENIEEDTTFNIMDFEELPKEVPGITKTYKVFGNAEQIKDLETFLNAVIPEWEVL